MKVLPPSNPADAYGLLRSAIDDADPVLFIENMPGYWARGEAPAAGHRVPIGAASVVATGSDITIVGYSRMLNECRAALDPLREAGVSVELIDLR
ncbi:MAG TPA: transketolase C-terminal domain-containing protein, partial [Caulobacteraceae bacterium]|nr:transketolase C-terminal domain-containing protein [Caulobacteraceae bacterium]